MKKYREPLLYVIVGGMTTVVNFAVYLFCSRILGISLVASQVICWICAVAFAYLADKIVVFHSHAFDAVSLVKEITTFVGARLVSGGMDIGLFYLFCIVVGFNDIIVKIFTQVLVVILNYLFSKYVIFKHKKEL